MQLGMKRWGTQEQGAGEHSAHKGRRFYLRTAGEPNPPLPPAPFPPAFNKSLVGERVSARCEPTNCFAIPHSLLPNRLNPDS
jgi:hypothetical protein